MAKILTTKGCAALIEDIIKNADKELYLISYSFIISDQFYNKIKLSTEKGVLVNVIYGKSLKQEDFDRLTTLKNIKIHYLKDLHAKIFANQQKCVVGSMNFSAASEINNYELGVAFSQVNDSENFNTIIQNCKEILSTSSLIYPIIKTSIPTNKPKSKNPLVAGITATIKSWSEDFSNKGHCIRCSSSIPMNADKPFCKECFKIWDNYKDYSYEEKHCHECGKKSKTSFSRPLCKSCYS